MTLTRISHRHFWLAVLTVFAIPACVNGQDFNVLEFDDTATGPWSDVTATTLTVPLVEDGSVVLDGKPSRAEYGGFDGVTVTPGDNAWLLPWPEDRQWDGADDSSFTFWLTYDSDFLYVGVDVKDDVVNSDDPNASFWRDDAIEIVTDVWNDNYDNNTDISQDAYGGHSYINYEGRFSAWNEETESIDEALRWSRAVEDWTYGEEGDVFGFGEATETGWNMEVRFHKRLFEDPDAGIELVEGTKMGFNIGLDDDDKFGTGLEGDATRTQDLELQYFWANRERFFGWNEDEDDGFFSQDEIATAFEQLGEGTIAEGFPLTNDWGINQGGRLSHGGAGEIIFGAMSDVIIEEPQDPEVPIVDECDALTGGDFDKNGKVEFADFLVLSDSFGKEVSSHVEGDADCNGRVEFGDFLLMSDNFGKSGGDILTVVPVPEPNARLLILISLGGLFFSRQGKRKPHNS